MHFKYRTHFLAIGFIICSFTFYGQKKSADFTIIDSEGSEHQLYSDYLDKDKIVIIDLFFTNCPPCNTMAPFIKASYEKWGGGNDRVEFISLSPIDDDLNINSFQEVHQLTHPSSGTDGGGDLALEQYTNDFFGKFFGYPVLIIIKPNKEVIYDIHSSKGDEATIELLDFHIAAALQGEISELNANIFPNPATASSDLNIAVPDNSDLELSVFDYQGKLHSYHAENILNNGVYKFDKLLQNLDSGFYFLEVKEKKQRKLILKFVIL